MGSTFEHPASGAYRPAGTNRYEYETGEGIPLQRFDDAGRIGAPPTFRPSRRPGHPMPSLNRRSFLHTSGLTLTAAAFAGAADAPNDRVRVAIMGGRIRGKFHLGSFASQPNVEVTHLIEPDESIVPAALEVLAKKQKAVP